MVRALMLTPHGKSRYAAPHKQKGTTVGKTWAEIRVAWALPWKAPNTLTCPNCLAEDANRRGIYNMPSGEFHARMPCNASLWQVGGYATG